MKGDEYLMQCADLEGEGLCAISDDAIIDGFFIYALESERLAGRRKRISICGASFLFLPR